MMMPPAFRRLRLFPALIFCAVLLLGEKVFSIWSGVGQLSSAVPAAEAQTGPVPLVPQGGRPMMLASEEGAAKPKDEKAPAKGGEGKGEGKGGEGKGGEGGAPKGVIIAPSNVKPAGSDTGSTSVDPASAPSSAAAQDKPKTDGAGPQSPAEAELLESLARRRGALDQREREIDTREKLLQATELKVEQRINELKTIETRIRDMVRAHDEKGEAQLQSLVRVYESMKPKEAAKIFEQLEMPVLLDVVSRMKEGKIAPIMAAMDPIAAQRLTTELVNRKRSPLDLPSEGPMVPDPGPPQSQGVPRPNGASAPPAGTPRPGPTTLTPIGQNRG